MPLLTHTGVLSPESRSASELRRAPWFVLGANGFDGGRDAGGWGGGAWRPNGFEKQPFRRSQSRCFSPFEELELFGTFTFIFRGLEPAVISHHLSRQHPGPKSGWKKSEQGCSRCCSSAQSMESSCTALQLSLSG